MLFGKKPRILVIGLDGTPLSFLKKQVEDGKLPCLASLFKTGSLVEIKSTHPFVSCVAWSTYMTGKNPAKHRIFGFIDRKPGTYSIFIPNSSDMKAVTIWEILSDNRRSVLVMNVPVTYPPRKVNGYIVSCFLAPKLDGATYPEDLSSRLKQWNYEIDIDPWRARENLDNLCPDLIRVLKARTTSFINLLRERNWDFAQIHIMETDRLFHFLWKHMEDGHPKYASQFMEVMDEIDKALAEIFEAAGKDYKKIVLSDHGFCSVKKEIYLNRFLEERGYLKYKKQNPKSLEDIDPSRTKVFCLDPGRFYINLRGREAEGCVEKSEYYALREALREDLKRLHDENKIPVIRDVFFKEEIYKGDWIDLAPDIVINPVDGYDPKGAFGKTALTGTSPIVGMHTYDNAMLFVEAESLKEGSIMDVTPTILELMGIRIPSDFDGHSLISDSK